MSSSGTLRLNKYLTNLSLAYPYLGKIGLQVAPLMPSLEYAGSIFAHGADQFNRRTTEAESVGSHRIDFEAGTKIDFRTKRNALHSIIDDKKADNADKVAQYKVSHTENLTEILLNTHELTIAETYTDASLVTQTDALSGTDQFDNAAYAQNFEKKMITATKTVRTGSKGFLPNTMIAPLEVALYMADMNFVKDIKYTHPLNLIQGNIPGQIMANIVLPPVIKGLRVIIADALWNDANKGVAENLTAVWGKNILIGYVPPTLGLKSRFGLATVEYKSRRVFEERQTDPDGTKILVDWDYQLVTGDLKCWYLFTDVIS
jgi:hypothetical protein